MFLLLVAVAYTLAKDFGAKDKKDTHEYKPKLPQTLSRGKMLFILTALLP